jgi:hypothetical protein
MPSLLFIVTVAVLVLANIFFASERHADKKVESKLIKNIPPFYWSYTTLKNIIKGDEE